MIFWVTLKYLSFASYEERENELDTRNRPEIPDNDPPKEIANEAPRDSAWTDKPSPSCDTEAGRGQGQADTGRQNQAQAGTSSGKHRQAENKDRQRAGKSKQM